MKLRSALHLSTWQVAILQYSYTYIQYTYAFYTYSIYNKLVSGSNSELRLHVWLNLPYISDVQLFIIKLLKYNWVCE